jgi:hypothetical protein
MNRAIAQGWVHSAAVLPVRLIYIRYTLLCTHQAEAGKAKLLKQMKQAHCSA